LPMILARYLTILDALALQLNLRILPDGDLTEVGAQGINLSGGQR
jgi:ABC-type bacteriocin/lantibiotic exporter with double-glycine peptidase domain